MKSTLRALTSAATEEDLSVAIMILSFILVAAGSVMIFSATYFSSLMSTGSSSSFVIHQGVWLAIGIGAFFLFSRLRPSHLNRLAPLGTIAVLGLLGAVLIPGIGSSIFGSSRWIVVGPFQIQPSELAKLMLCLFLARVLSARSPNAPFKERTLPVVIVTGLCALLILVEPDYGTSVVLFLIMMGALFSSGTRLRELLLIVVGGGSMGVYFAFSQAYRRARILSFLNPWAHRLSTGYQEVQAFAAMASGHIFGVGIGAGQTSFNYLPNAPTDFIFAVVAQDAGLLGGIVLLILLCMLVVVLLRSGYVMRNTYDSVFTYSVAAWIAGQVFLNIAAVEGLAPITGVPLPLVSAGGSSTVIILVAVALVRGGLMRNAKSVEGGAGESVAQGGRIGGGASRPASGRTATTVRPPLQRRPPKASVAPDSQHVTSRPPKGTGRSISLRSAVVAATQRRRASGGQRVPTKAPLASKRRERVDGGDIRHPPRQHSSDRPTPGGWDDGDRW